MSKTWRRTSTTCGGAVMLLICVACAISGRTSVSHVSGPADAATASVSTGLGLEDMPTCLTLLAGMCRWQGKIIPVVRFVNGRVLECLPALFRADVAGQVRVPLAV